MENETVGRVSAQHHSVYRVMADGGEYTATVSGKLIHGGEMPVVGDYVRVRIEGETAVITQLMPRKSLISRKAAGSTEQRQDIAANVDIVFICMALDQNYNLRRLERYMAAVGGSGAEPAVLLTKADLCPDAKQRQEEIQGMYPDTRVILCSSVDQSGYDEAVSLIGSGVTAVFTGSSGVGKSTLINSTAGAMLKTGAVREDSRGRHTTTHRQLIMLQNGGAVIDTPGMRELALYDGDVEGAFPDIEELAAQCRFSNCSHRKEPGCAVLKALDEGRLDEKRYENYLKLKVEKRERIKKRMVFKR